MSGPNFNRPDNLMTALQYNATTGLPELRVNLGSDSVTITGSVNVGTVVEVSSTPTNPVHTHVSEVGTSGILAVPYMPSGIVDASGHINDPTHPLYVDFGSNALTVDQGTSPWIVSGTVTANQGTSPWVVSGNVNVANQATDLSIADSTYEMNVARGLVAGQYQELKNGFATGISQGASVTIWNEATLYPWASWTAAQKLYVISTSASDVGKTIRIDGLDAAYNKITEDVVVNGTTAVATTQNFLRLNRGYLISGTANVGVITERLGNGTGTVVGSMYPGFSRNKGGFFTVPAGYTAYIQYGDATQFRGGSGNIGGLIEMYTRTGNGPFLCQIVSEVVNGHYRNDFTVPLGIPERTDIDVRITADGNGTQATCSWQMIMIPN